MSQVNIILPAGTTVTRTMTVKSSEIKSIFALKNDQKVSVSENMKFMAGDVSLAFIEYPNKGDNQKYTVTLPAGVKYYNEFIKDGTLAYAATVELMPNTEVMLIEGTRVWLNLGTNTSVTLDADNIAKIM